MAEFLVDCNLLLAHSEEFIQRIPQQREVVNELMLDGKICTYSVSLNRKKLWIVFSAKNEEEVMQIISEFPLIDFLDIDIHPLLFHQNPSSAFSQISLN